MNSNATVTSAFEMTYIVSSGALNSTHSLTHRPRLMHHITTTALKSWRYGVARNLWQRVRIKVILFYSGHRFPGLP